MDFVIDFLHVGDGDAIIVWAREINNADFVFFIDGGNTGNGQKIVDHYNTYIKPFLQEKRLAGFVNSHPHEDHINGLLEVINILGDEIKFGIYNDPVECITEEHRKRISKEYIQGTDADITHLYETFEQVEKLNKFCVSNNVKRYYGYAAENNFLNGAFKIVSPSKDFYVNLVQYFSDVDFLKTKDFTKKTVGDINQIAEAVMPCEIVDESDDASPENMTSIVIQLTDSQARKIILTADAGVETFNYMEDYLDLKDIVMVQLPHHGSRRNINSAWIKKFSPSIFVASAAGNLKHPRRAVINCIKRNLPFCKTYSTHTDGKCISYTTNHLIFPQRNWADVQPL